MALPNSGDISIIDVRNELGEIGNFSLIEAGGITLNDCSSGGDVTSPYVLTNWYGYDHSAVPPTASGLSTNPGESPTPDGNPDQDVDIYVSWNNITCADNYDLLVSSTIDGTYTTETSNIPFTNTIYNLGVSDTSRYFKIKANSSVGTFSTSSAIEGRTAPRTPQSIFINVTQCNPLEFSVSWNNGTSPGVRQSVVRWQWAVTSSSEPIPSWSSYMYTTTGSTSDSTTTAETVDNTYDIIVRANYLEEGAFAEQLQGIICIT